MSLYLPVRSGSSVAIAVCPRCKFKVHYSGLRQDPNTKTWVCEGCVDLYDPWKLPATNPEDITLQHPFADSSIALDAPVSEIIGTESGEVIITQTGLGLEVQR